MVMIMVKLFLYTIVTRELLRLIRPQLLDASALTDQFRVKIRNKFQDLEQSNKIKIVLQNRDPLAKYVYILTGIMIFELYYMVGTFALLLIPVMKIKLCAIGILALSALKSVLHHGGKKAIPLYERIDAAATIALLLMALSSV